MILSFRSKDAESIWRGNVWRRLALDMQAVARRKLRMLNNARLLDDLRIPPGNRLEALQGRRKGQNSIRINDQWRLCFRWTDAGPSEVELVDYH
jgi:proteic killer suppression protein